MDGQNNPMIRAAWIGLTVLTVATLLVFAFVFLDAGSLLDHSAEKPPVNSNTNTDTLSTDTDRISSDIAEYRTLMNRYQTRLDSPYLLPVNEENPIPDSYTVELGSLNWGDGTLQLEKSAASAMNTFLSAAERAGYSVTVVAAYRSEAQQIKVYEDAVSGFVKAGFGVDEARAKAAQAVGSVGCSEHQLGFAVDFDTKDLVQKGYGSKTFEAYLNENIHKFGFILSYPAKEEATTGRNANTAHYRYVGVEVATEMKEKTYVTLAEYRNYLSTQINYYKQQIDSLEKR